MGSLVGYVLVLGVFVFTSKNRLKMKVMAYGYYDRASLRCRPLPIPSQAC